MPLIGLVHTRGPRRAEEELRRGGDDRPAVAGQRPRPERREARGQRGRIAVEVRAQVLDEIDLVDVAAPDRLAHRLDRAARTPRRSSSAPTRRSANCPHGTCRGQDPDTSRTATAASGRAQGSGGSGDACRRSGRRERRSRGRGRPRGPRRRGRRSRARARYASICSKAPSGERSSSTSTPASGPRRGGSRRRDPGRRRASARRRSGSGARRAPSPSSSSGRSRTRPCRTPRGASASP